MGCNPLRPEERVAVGALNRIPQRFRHRGVAVAGVQAGALIIDYLCVGARNPAKIRTPR